MTSLKTAPDAILSLDDAMKTHIARNNSNLERWATGRAPGKQPSSLSVEGHVVTAAIQDVGGLMALGVDHGETWLTVVVPDIAFDSLRLELVKL
ncbi:MAG: hypothetical protein ACOH19_15610 [Rhodoglobus sp.]